MSIPTLEPVCCVEWEAFAAEKLAESMEKEGMGQIPVWSDLRTFDGAYWRGAVDWIIAGFPCQPFSLAGSGLGVDDPRHLWPHVARIIGEVQPDYVFLENVPGLVSNGKGAVLAGILGRLQEMDYEVAFGLFTAEEVGASHKRGRVFIFGVKQAVVYDWNRTQGHRGSAEEIGSWVETNGLGDSSRELGIPFGARRAQAERFDIDAGQESAKRSNDVALAQLANNNNNKGLERHGGHDERGGELPVGSGGVGVSEGILPLYPPGPDDWDAWLECLLLDPRCAPAQSKVHLLADGMADDRAAWLRLTGNGVVDLQAAYALATLWSVILHGGK